MDWRAMEKHLQFSVDARETVYPFTVLRLLPLSVSFPSITKHDIVELTSS